MTTCLVLIAMINALYATMAGSIYQKANGGFFDLLMTLSFAFTAGVALLLLWRLP